MLPMTIGITQSLNSHCGFFVWGTVRFVHLNLIAYLILKAHEAQGSSGVVARGLDEGYQNLLCFPEGSDLI